MLVLGPKHEPDYTLAQLWDFYHNPFFIVFASGVLAFMATLFVTRNREEWALCIEDLGSSDAAGYWKRKNAQHVRLNSSRRAATAALAGCFATFSNLSLKCVIEIAKAGSAVRAVPARQVGQCCLHFDCAASHDSTLPCAQGEPVFQHWYTYFITLVAVFCACNQLHWLNTALQHFDGTRIVHVLAVVNLQAKCVRDECPFAEHPCLGAAITVVPIVGVTSVTGQTLGSVCLFKEFEEFSAMSWVLFPLAVLVICIGICMLAQREHGLVEPSISPRKRRPRGATSSPTSASTAGDLLPNDFTPTAGYGAVRRLFSPPNT
eukprot:SAG11_NODE_3387_length_2479_cov_4.557983_1_plen_319_part_00